MGRNPVWRGHESNGDLTKASELRTVHTYAIRSGHAGRSGLPSIDCAMSNLNTYLMSPNSLSKLVDGGKELTKGVVPLSSIFSQSMCSYHRNFEIV